MHTYLNQLQHVLNHGIKKEDRTGVGTISCFGLHARYAMADGFPAVTTKRLVWKSMLSELLWFISGSNDIKKLKAMLKSNRLWDGNYKDYHSKARRVYKADGDMGRIYGVQWRAWQGYGRKKKKDSEQTEQDLEQTEIDFGVQWPKKKEVGAHSWRRLRDRHGNKVDQLQDAIDLILENPESRRILVDTWNAAEVTPYQNVDQLQDAIDLILENPESRRILVDAWNVAGDQNVDQLKNAIDLIRENPESRRILVDAWNAAEVTPYQVALPPCHVLFQFYVAEGKLSLQMYQRSCDMFLGVPLNIASYSVLLHMVAKITGLVAHEFIHVLGDAHIYLNHLDAVKEQLSRKPYPLPKLHIEDRGQTKIEDFEMDDFELINYQHHDTIRAEMAV